MSPEVQPKLRASGYTECKYEELEIIRTILEAACHKRMRIYGRCYKVPSEVESWNSLAN